MCAGGSLSQGPAGRKDRLGPAAGLVKATPFHPFPLECDAQVWGGEGRVHSPHGRINGYKLSGISAIIHYFYWGKKKL